MMTPDVATHRFEPGARLLLDDVRGMALAEDGNGRATRYGPEASVETRYRG
ncbi:MAG: hypothetical protein OXF01_11260 [Gemmatimonadetes bacterium]|nr:hypothetical protein [Gemmatimonadota bacterium]